MYSVRYRTHHDATKRLKEKFKVDINKDEYVVNVLNNKATRERVLYIHVPYCNKICSFCPFHRPDNIRRDEYYEFVIAELKRISKFEYSKKPLKAINFGGGTPTAIRPSHMMKILDTIRECFTYTDDIEISVETSITELTEEMIDVLIKGGVNRLSIGVQTFNNDARKVLNRRGDQARVINKINELHEKGFTNINVDLIYNYPGQTKEALLEDIRIIKELNLAGISFYSLMIHEKTPIAKKITSEDLALMNDFSHEYMLFETIVKELGSAGFEPFEFTKLIRNKMDRYLYMEVRHNQGDCIAVGLGAGGNIGNYIYHNKEGFTLLENSKLSAMGRVEDDLYFKLDQLVHNLERGEVSLSHYGKLLNLDLKAIWKEVLNRLENEKMIIMNNDSFEYTLLGRFYGNNIIDELIATLINYQQSN